MKKYSATVIYSKTMILCTTLCYSSSMMLFLILVLSLLITNGCSFQTNNVNGLPIPKSITSSTTSSATSASSASSTSSAATTKHCYYKYFAIGSNMVPSTMTCLRNLSPISATAAILPNYELRFNIPNVITPWIEPSAASVQKLQWQQQFSQRNDETQNNNDDGDGGHGYSCVHGVLYTLTEEDFVQLGRSEGVPYAYIWERCYPIPYIGNNLQAGQDALLLHQQQQQQIATSTTNVDDVDVLHDPEQEAFVLTANPLLLSLVASSLSSKSFLKKDIPPSKSYLEILQDGGKYWKMDLRYQRYLQNDIVTNPIVPGISKLVLLYAERNNPRNM